MNIALRVRCVLALVFLIIGCLVFHLLVRWVTWGLVVLADLLFIGRGVPSFWEAMIR